MVQMPNLNRALNDIEVTCNTVNLITIFKEMYDNVNFP